ncbi:MAG: pyridoxal phosphate-dependent aminotransferase family protein [Vicinamibacterales bacterium]
MPWTATDFSLADFYVSDTDDPLVPPADYLAWRRDTAWATSLYEPVLCDPAAPVNHLRRGDGRHRVINMTSYGYLGLVRHPAVVAAAKQALDEFGTGACGSPILSGKSVLHERLEGRLAALTGREAVLVYNSGFGGALGTAAGLMRKGDVALVDARAHISLVDGIKVGGARVVFFEHNDAAALDRTLTATAGARRLIFVDGLYSMDGDFADLPRLLDVAEAHRVGLLVDEAHSILCCGPTGGGVVEHFGVRGRVGLQYGTFSKGFSAAGGFAAASRDLVEYLRFYANPYGFTCALPPAVVAGLVAALDVMDAEPERRQALWDNAAYFRGALQAMGVDTGTSTSYVVPMVVGDRPLLYELGHALRDRGLFVTPVDYPTVPLDQARFRASVTALHTKADLNEALQVLEDVFVPVMRQRGRLRSA